MLISTIVHQKSQMGERVPHPVSKARLARDFKISIAAFSQGAQGAHRLAHRLSLTRMLLYFDRPIALVEVPSLMGFLVLRSIFESFDVGIFRIVAIIMRFYLRKLL